MCPFSFARTCNRTCAPALLYNNRLQMHTERRLAPTRGISILKLFIVSQLQDQILFTASLCTYTAGTHAHLRSSSSALHSAGSSCHQTHQPLNTLGVELQDQMEAKPPGRQRGIDAKQDVITKISLFLEKHSILSDFRPF